MESAGRLQEFCKFLTTSPSPYHAVQNMARKLEATNFTRLRESVEWTLTPGSRYYVTRNNSSIVAFTLPNTQSNKESVPVMIVGAHCDSPCLKLKVKSARGVKEAFSQVAVETYGGGLWHTWFDRDLGLAGRILYNTKGDVRVKEKLVDIDRPVFRIPTLAIHLDRSVSSEGFKFNNELQLQPLFGTGISSEEGDELLPAALKQQLVSGLKDSSEEVEILGHDLCLYDINPACVGGLNGEFVLSGRLDNLFMSFCAIEGLIAAEHNDRAICMTAIFDNEEVGSQSPPGADSNFIPSVLEQISACLAKYGGPACKGGLLVSADMAHAAHPNYAEKHDSGHRPRINEGLVIKHHSGCRYATTSRVAAAIRAFCAEHGLAVQDFMVRNDSPCGSTIGPMLASRLGLPCIDVGMAQLSMHSIREMAGTLDLEQGVRFCQLLYSNTKEVFENLLIVD